MNCKNCGTPLMGMEHACPVCGAPLPTNTPQPGMAQPMVPGQVMPEQLASQPPQMMPGGTAPMGLPTAEPEAPQPEPKKGNNMFAILLLVVAFAAIGVGVFLAMTDTKEETKPADNNQTEEQPVDNPSGGETTGGVNYAGYSFTVPENYSGAEVGAHGLTLHGNSVIYTILIDYTKDYAYYKQEFQKQQTAPTQVLNVGDREYVIATVTDAGNGAQAIEYMTKAGETSTFAGLVVKSDFTAGGEADLAELNSILSSAVQQTEIAPGADEDAGKTEIVNYIPKFVKDDFAFVS